MNKFTWLLIITLTLCGVLLVAGCVGLPYYVGEKIKSSLIALGAPSNIIVKPSYWKQNVKIENLEIIPPSPSFIKKIVIPEIFLSYNGGFLFHHKVQIIKISTIEILIPDSQINLQQTLPFNDENFYKYTHLLPKQKLTINAIVIKDTHAAYPNNIITLKCALQPNLIIKHHYTLHLSLQSLHMRVLSNKTTIEGNKVTAKLDGTLKLENGVLFDGKLQIYAEDGLISPHELRFKKGKANMDVEMTNNDYSLKGKYELHHLNKITKAVPAVGDIRIPQK